MQRKSCKLLIIVNPQPTILLVQARGNGVLGEGEDGESGHWSLVISHWWKKENIKLHSIVQGCQPLPDFAAGVYLPEGRHPIIPFFQHSIIPVVSAANLSS
jgi:hypothetical protein